MLRKKIIISTILFILISFWGTVFICNAIIDNSAKGKLYTDVTKIPFNKVGMLLGVPKFVLKGSVNPYYPLRIQAAIKLIRNKKIKYIIVSGDRMQADQMRGDLINAGIDSSIIYADTAGLRTFDSVIRLKKIFDQGSVTFISQPAHNARAIYIATREKIFAVGFNAKDSHYDYLYNKTHEKLAAVKVFIDFFTGEEAGKQTSQKVSIPQ